jgi:hypothetical protein
VPLTEMVFLTPTFRNVFPITEAHIPWIKELQLFQHKVCGQDSEGMDVSISVGNLCNMIRKLCLFIGIYLGCLVRQA